MELNPILKNIDSLISRGNYQEAAKLLLSLEDVTDTVLLAIQKTDKISLQNSTNGNNVAIALNVGGLCIDTGSGLQDEQIVRKGIRTLRIIKDHLVENHPLYASCCYNIGNGLSTICQWKQHSSPHHYPVGDPDLEEAKKLYREILNQHKNQDDFRARLLVNYGNLLHGRLGRTLEAFEAFDAALSIIPNFEMALANKAYSQFLFARIVGKEDGIILLHEAYVLLKRALAGNLDAGPRKYFESIVVQIKRLMPHVEELGEDISCAKEIQRIDQPFQRFYRSFCQQERLYLNPLGKNHKCEAALCDPVLFKGMMVDKQNLDTPYLYASYINQIKQEYVFARFQAAQSFYKDAEFEFVDKGVTQINTLDYPIYSIYLEQAKSAFRTAISILDKVAFTVNEYLNLGLNPKKIYFSSVASLDSKNGKGIMAKLTPLQNHYAAAIIDLANDFHNEHFKPLKELRNEFEHRFRSIHLFSTSHPFLVSPTPVSQLAPNEFRSQVLNMLRVAKSAIIYLILMIDSEEATKKAKIGSDRALPLFFENIADEFKRE